MENLTTGPIKQAIEQFHLSLSLLKLQETVIRKEYTGVSQKTWLILLTNRESLKEVKKRTEEGIKGLEGMRHQSISAIKSFVEETRKAIEAVDVSKMVEMKVDETEYYRFQTPEGNIHAAYSGPMSGLPLPPMKGD